ncbi:hypothetical protein Tco_0691215 [Tanacetum coccineum]
MGQVHTNQGLTADLLGPDSHEDYFAERNGRLIARKKRDFAAQSFRTRGINLWTYAQQKAYMRTFVIDKSSSFYFQDGSLKHVKSFSDDQLKTEFDKIRAAVAELKSQNIRRSLKRPGADLGDLKLNTKMCIKYASDADSAPDDDTPVNLYAVVD